MSDRPVRILSSRQDPTAETPFAPDSPALPPGIDKDIVLNGMSVLRGTGAIPWCWSIGTTRTNCREISGRYGAVEITQCLLGVPWQAGDRSLIAFAPSGDLWILHVGGYGRIVIPPWRFRSDPGRRSVPMLCNLTSDLADYWRMEIIQSSFRR